MKTGSVNNLILLLSTVVLMLLSVALFIGKHPEPEPLTQGEFVQNEFNNDTTPDLSIIPDFASIRDVAEKKRTFFDFLRPAISYHNGIIADERQFLINLQLQLQAQEALSDAQEFRVYELANKYQLSMRSVTSESLEDLLTRVDIVPENLVLIQAANETGWGSSRFAREGRNFFGQWCFRKGCGLVPQSRNEGANHEVAVFKTVDDSVGSYMKNLNSNAAYDVLRNIRADLRAKEKPVTADKLVHGLINYSERQEEYIDELLEMLRHNEKFLVANNA